MLGIALVGAGAAGLAGVGPLAMTAAAHPSAPVTAASPSAPPAAGSSPSQPASLAVPTASLVPTAAPTIAVTAAPTPDLVAAVGALYARLVPAIRANDVATLTALLHPATIERYGEAACRTYFAALRDPTFNVVVHSVAAPAPWIWDRDGRSTTIPDALAVQADLTANGTTSAQEIHVAPVGGELRWFTDCGTPLSA
jgi:hypothetical protein